MLWILAWTAQALTSKAHEPQAPKPAQPGLFVIGADAVYRSTRLRCYGIRSEPHKMNGRLEMSTGPVASPSAVAARVAADNTRSSACPPRAAERRRRRGWKARSGGDWVICIENIPLPAFTVTFTWVQEFGCEATMFIVRSAFDRFLHQDNSGGGGGPLEQEFRTDAWPLLLDYKVSTNYT
uniref:Uncharacterized protein n=1 Tax=Oryza meridionalis TaxID=40149 RepID=A0A0E0CPD6_9ORYZ